MHQVLSNSEDSVVKSTLNRLPVEAVLPLSKELVSLVQSRRSSEYVQQQYDDKILIIILVYSYVRTYYVFVN